MRLKSWGMYPRIKSKNYTLKSRDDLSIKLLEPNNFICYGNGRSYGDSALNKNIIYTKSYNSIIKFDKSSGILHCQSGVLLKDIINLFAPHGWFLKVTPGTKYTTVGGAIASDVHGKNHHIDGCFSNCIMQINIMLPNGKIKSCSKSHNQDLFNATCGGMGLTGVIMEAKISLKRINSTNIDQTTIKTKNLAETFEAFEKYSDTPYSVAWIDCMAKGESIGRSILMVGDFSNDGDFNLKKKIKISIPFNIPSLLMNKIFLKLFNWLYYNINKKGVNHKKVDLDSFFYPLDRIKNWNRFYGKNGFTQYQFILPKDDSFNGIIEILKEIENSGKGSFLAVLKLHGKENSNYLSFPMEGYSLALDFKIEDDLFELLERLDSIILKYKGRIYLSKDVRVSKETFEKGYPKIERFRLFREKNNMMTKFQSLQSKRLCI